MGLLRNLSQQATEIVPVLHKSAYDYLYGLKIAWVSLASVILGVLIFWKAPPVKDLFLEVTGDNWLNLGFWFIFYLCVILAWAVPVYICSRWVLSRFEEGQTEAPVQSDNKVPSVRPVQTRARRIIPMNLVVMCFAAILIGQVGALSNAPSIKISVNEAETACQNQLSAYLRARCETDETSEKIAEDCKGRSRFCQSLHAINYPVRFLERWASYSLGSGKVLLIIYAASGLMFLWIYLQSWIESLSFWSARAIGRIAWWLVTVSLSVPLFIAVLFVIQFTVRQWSIKFGIGHLLVLPMVTIFFAFVAVWGLRLDRSGKVTPTGKMLLKLFGVQRPVDDVTDKTVTDKVVVPSYWAILMISALLILIAIFIHPVHIANYIYRAPLLPFLLGVLVAPFTYFTYCATRHRFPLVLLLILILAVIPTMFGDTNDVRILRETAAVRETLDETILQWGRVNRCDPTKRDNDCPSPIIISAAGGGSRSAFHVAGVIGKLIDETTVVDQEVPQSPDTLSGISQNLKLNSSTNSNLRSFKKQLFAISAVSGGATGAVITYAALADSQHPDRAQKNGLGNPPCNREYHDNDWFGSSASGGQAGIKSVPQGQAKVYPSQVHKSWRGCLQLLAAGDFLSPVLLRLFTTDLMHIRTDPGDRAAVLEEAWEMRYKNLTGYNTLSKPLVDLRKKVRLEDEENNWLPILLLNGTSVSTGRRIVTSDIETRIKPFGNPVKRMFRDSYDLHELFAQKRDAKKPLLSDWNAISGEKVSDIRLSTAATMSARFPIISPHGNIRGKERKVIDEVVDGGYFENFGATTAAELAGELIKKQLKPIIILVNNEPTVSSIECIRETNNLARPQGRQRTFFASLSSPVTALLGTRQARGSHAAGALCSVITDRHGDNSDSNRFAFITVKPDESDPNKVLPVSWWLSKHVQKYLDEQLDGTENGGAFRKIMNTLKKSN